MDLVIFDLDGTLVDSKPEILATLRASLRACELPEDWADRMHIGPPVAQMIRTALPQLSEPVVDNIHHYFRRLYDASEHSLTKAFDGMEKVLEELAAHGALLAIATNKPQVPTKTLVARLFGERFQSVLSPDSIAGRTMSKADMVGEISACRTSDITRTFIVGDAVSDVEAGQWHGCRTVAVTYGYSSETELRSAHPDHLVHRPRDLVPIILGKH